ncbi:MAG: FAD binding domain-containing protein, partial [Actinobacteria bacterium]|nr:FAD binding domain-containing protein [Actinomycetota bacterium]
NAGEYLTLDKKRLVADHITRWRIADPLAFYITVRDEVGGRARLDDIVCSDAVGRNVPVLAEAARTIGSQQIRNVATLGGNLCNASPSADMSPALVALRGTAVVRSMAGEREVAFEDFFRGPGATCLAADEILVEIKVPKPGPATGAWYAKLHARSAIDLAVVGVAAAVTLESDGSTVSDARLVLGAVAPVPLRAREAERMFIAAGLSEDALARVAETAAGEAQPISDIRATAEYRREMVRVLTAQALRKAAARVNGATP